MWDQQHADALRMLLRRLDFHSDLGAEDQQLVLKLPGIVARIKAQVDFVRAGEWVDTACLVQSGLVARAEDLSDGRRQLVSLHFPGDLVDLQSLWLTNAPTTIQAIEPSTIVRIPHAALRQAIAGSPKLNAALWRDATMDAAMLAQAVVRVGHLDAFARIAHLFCEVAVRLDQVGLVNGRSYRFAITQEQLSFAIGMTSVHVNRTLKALRNAGLCILQGGHLEVIDWPGLKRAAGFDGSYLTLRQSSPAARLSAGR